MDTELFCATAYMTYSYSVQYEFVYGTCALPLAAHCPGLRPAGGLATCRAVRGVTVSKICGVTLTVTQIPKFQPACHSPATAAAAALSVVLSHRPQHMESDETHWRGDTALTCQHDFVSVYRTGSWHVGHAGTHKTTTHASLATATT